MKKYILFTILLTGVSCIFAQINPSDTPELFKEYSVMSRIDILIDSDSLSKLQNYVHSSDEYRADFVFTNGNGIQDTIRDIGFKLRGNGSRTNLRKSYKVSFNSFEAGRKYYGFEKVNLKATNDDSHIRPKLCWYMMREMGIPAVWTSHVQLYMAGKFYGVYYMIEHIDEEYLERIFDNKEGNLYKCRYPSALLYRGSDQDNYKIEYEYYNERVLRMYDLKTNEEADDYTDLMNLADVLNNTPIDQLADTMKSIFNMDQLLKLFAMEVYTGDWDSYSGNGNNYYLYNNPETGKFQLLPTDKDLTLGILYGLDMYGDAYNIYSWYGDMATYNGFEPQPPLRHRILQIDEFRDKYSYYLRQLINTLPPDTVRLRAEEIQDYIYPYVSSYSGSQYSQTQFSNMLDMPIGADYGVIQFLERMEDTILFKLDDSRMAPVISDVDYTSYSSGNRFRLTCTTENEGVSFDNFNLYTRVNGGLWSNRGPASSVKGKLWGQKHHAFELTEDQKNCTIDFFMLIQDENGITRSPKSGLYTAYLNVSKPDIKINELMASNNYSVTDDYGEREDWVELYNAGDSEVNLANLYLSDRFGNKDKWKLPDINIAPQGHAVFWTDKDNKQGDKHTNFKLSGSGETVYLFEMHDSVTFTLVDSMKFANSVQNKTYGRITDGSETLVYLDHITPGHPNDSRGLAYAVFTVDMRTKADDGGFSIFTDTIDVSAGFNGYNGSLPFASPDSDSIYRYTEFDLSQGERLECRYRIVQNDNPTDSTDVYYYILTEGCNNFFEVYSSTVVSAEDCVSDISESDDVSVFPNPASEVFYIRSETGINQFHILSMSGNVIQSITNVDAVQAGVYISSLPSGIYMVKVVSDNGKEYNQRLIKE